MAHATTTAAAPELLDEHGAFGGRQGFWRHDSAQIGLPMHFAVYLPSRALGDKPAKVPVLLCLAGLTCTEETFATKAGAQRVAAELGLALVMPDTSPRGAGIPGEADAWDFGVGAGFYLDATRAPWAAHWRMESYLIDELLPLVGAHFSIDRARAGIVGHSMGGHGALTLALRHPGVFASVSAIAPIAAASRCPWGEKAFAGYLGDNRAAWQAHDACELMSAEKSAPYPRGILIDQGDDDKFLAEQLHPHLFEAACAQVGQPLTLNYHAGCDHGYYFIATVVESHLRFHAPALGIR